MKVVLMVLALGPSKFIESSRANYGHQR